MLYYLLRSIKRKKMECMVILVITIALVILMNLYFESIRSYELQLADLSDHMPVYCRVTNPIGNRESGLLISYEIVDKIKKSEFVCEEAYSSWMMAGVGNFPQKEWQANLELFVTGINTPMAIPGLNMEQLHMEAENSELILTKNKFFFSKEPICIVSQSEMDKRGWKIGDVIPLNLYHYIYDNATLAVDVAPLDLVNVKIAGSMDDIASNTSVVPPDVILPFDTVRRIFQDMNKNINVDSLSFYVKDPLKLNEFKKEMRTIGFQEKNFEAPDSYTGIALTVRDNNFIATANQLRESMDVLKGFLPVIFLVILAIGYVVSFLLSNNRKIEFALLRVQGISASKCVFMFIAEHMLLVIIGNAIGDVLCYLINSSRYTILWINVFLLIFYLFGAATAFWQIGRKSSMQTLFVDQ